MSVKDRLECQGQLGNRKSSLEPVNVIPVRSDESLTEGRDNMGDEWRMGWI